MSETTGPASEDERRIVLRIRSGSRANQVEELPLSGRREVVFGRDPDVDLRFDEEIEDLVSRRHARLTWNDAGGELEFSLEDLGSSNGTWLKGQPISGPARMRPGDTIRLGEGGPEVVFDVEPQVRKAPPPEPPELPKVPSMSETAPTLDATEFLAMSGEDKTTARRWLPFAAAAIAVAALAAAGLAVRACSSPADTTPASAATTEESR